MTTTIQYSRQDALGVLQRYWGHDEFRPKQWEVIDAIVNQKKDAIVILATSGGKSLAFQLPPLMCNTTVVVVCPMLSLARDQVDGLELMAVKACALNGEVDDTTLWHRAWSGEFSLVYISPETLQHCVQGMQKLDRAGKLLMVAVDESHAVSEYGHEFRPKLRELRIIRKSLPDVPILALTATATKLVEDDIVEQLQLKTPFRVRTSTNRVNLSYEVRNKFGMKRDITKELLGSEPVIVFASTKKLVDQLAGYINTELCIKAGAYHSDHTKENREQVHRDFLLDKISVVVCTSGFGLGINKPDIRRIIHYALPSSIESYIQQVGRGSRDGLPCKCVLFWSNDDVETIHHLIQSSGERGLALFKPVKEFVHESTKCLRRILLEYFEELSTEDCNNCSTCWARSGDGPKIVKQDVTAEARLVCLAVSELNGAFAIGLVMDVLRNTNEKQVIVRSPKFRVPFHLLQSKGKLSWMKRPHLQSLCNALLSHNVLKQVSKRLASGFSWKMIELDTLGKDLLRDPQLVLKPLAIGAWRPL